MSHLSDKITQNLNDKTATIAVIGLGYVGLPLLLRIHDCGFSVIGLDIDESKINDLENEKSYIKHITPDKVSALIKERSHLTTDFQNVRDADIIIMCVPTPLNKYREPDISYITNTLASIQPHLKAGHVVCLESTTYPGTCTEEVKPRLEEKGFTVGDDIFLVYSPEREDPGNKNFTTHTIPKVVGGETATCLKIGTIFYEHIIDKVVPVSSTQTAEMTKLLENIHRAVNIGLVNEMKVIADKMGIDIHEVIDAAATKPFGFTPYYPGPGLGGHCIPIDPFYLSWKAREYGLNTRFIELSGEINHNMPHYVVDKLTSALNDRKIALNGANILTLGIAYKPNVNDMRESPAVAIMEILRDRGANIHYSDPHVPTFPKMRAHTFDLDSIALSPKALASYDAVILATDHADFDYDMIANNAPLIIDTRGKYRDVRDNVVKA